jgi:tungstate transport system substrate-binding protein
MYFGRLWLALACLSVSGLVLALFASPISAGAEPAVSITVASTTSTENSGLFDYLLPKFTAQTGIGVRVVAVGTGQALRLARNGDADVLLVHHRESEEEFVAGGYGVERHELMRNDFVVLGPVADPAGIRGGRDATEALRAIAETGHPFASRGDGSGTHKKELEIWAAAGVDPAKASGGWYRETGSGMGATLNTAVGMDAYVLSDRATWLNFENKGGLELLVEGDERLLNPYAVILVNPARFPHVKAEAGQAFIEWLLSPTGQALIGNYRIAGSPAFFTVEGK